MISCILMRYYGKRRGGFKRRGGIKGREIKRLVFSKKKNQESIPYSRGDAQQLDVLTTLVDAQQA